MRVTNSGILTEQWLGNRQAIVALDPIRFDHNLKLLHLLNKSGDTKEIIQLLYRSLPVPDTLDAYSYEEAIATMRDLGIFIGILKKHGIEPVEVVPELEYVLLVLMVKTDLPPRDTLLHYTLWNPSGPRMRTYTGLADEKHLIESVQIAMPDLMEAVVQLEALHQKDLYGPQFAIECHDLREKMEKMVNGIVHAKRNVSPAVFANELRFYYDPIKVDYNKEYIGPGAVEMPMFVFDHLLWSSDCSDPEYTRFKEGLLPYSLRFIRDIYWRFNNTPSLVSRLQQMLNEKPCIEYCQAAQAALDLCTVLKSFRMPHKKLAENAYAHSDEHHREKGSGGYSTDVLQHIIRLQLEKITALHTSAANARVRLLN